MLAALLFAAALASPQDPGATVDPGPIRLEDVVVDAQRLEDAAEAYVDLVAAPVSRRGLARWHVGVCVGVANLEPEVAQYVADRVSDLARDLGLRAHEPPCHPSILIVATTGGAAFTEQFVAMRPVLFRPGGSGMNQGPAAFERFLTSDAAVRWWNISQPTDSDTGQSTVRMPGQCNRTCIGSGSAMDYAPNTAVRGVSRLSSQYRQDMKRAFVIIDVDRLGQTSLAQLGDYLAMVTLAQIDPDADTRRFDTILNLFDDPATAPAGLTGWDRAYLDGLYGDSESTRINQRSQVQAVAASIARAYRAQPEDETPAGPTP
ncbi:hypothetical protein [Brevundimonas sp. LjRoot202]|uniref:hypothetical protein n=1 Tax=Brevundimonas sp. LjRoot202 TaxID=3342281 RepID=UPI003ECDAB53